ncbi:hypothetical protein J3F84DRAFT_365941 [Trichoderma pleuroticola]
MFLFPFFTLFLFYLDTALLYLGSYSSASVLYANALSHLTNMRLGFHPQIVSSHNKMHRDCINRIALNQPWISIAIHLC